MELSPDVNAEREVLDDFYVLSDYLAREGKIDDPGGFKESLSSFLLHAQHIKSYDFVSPFCSGKKILDIGCFIGYGEKRISPFAKEIIAIDSDGKAIAFCRNNRAIPNARFERIDAKTLPFPDATFDIVIAFQLIEHISPDKVKGFLFEAKRVLKESGSLFITTPNSQQKYPPAALSAALEPGS